jgi:DNA-binding NtrC family response regulator
MSASMIENHWLSDDCNNRLRIHFHGRAEFIGTLLEGILVIAPDGRIVGANRSALEQLGLSGAALRAQSLATLFSTTPAAVYDHFRAPMSAPLRLSAPDGRPFHATARFDWPSRPMALGLGAADDAAPEPPQAAPVSRDAAVPRAAQPFSGLQYLRTGDARLDTVIGKIRQVLDRDIPLLILGETGTGKELLARAVHHDSARSRQPFVAVNCASIPESLIEAELFGYEEGAFTGARRKGAPGRIVQAHGGTLFLDEVGDMPMETQNKILRVLVEQTFQRQGGTAKVNVDVRIISSTARNLEEEIAAGRFREDLYHRLSVVPIRVPPLSERREDIPELIDYFMDQISTATGLPKRQIGQDAMAVLQSHVWPGNVRQLRNNVERVMILAGGGPEVIITADMLPQDVGSMVPAMPTSNNGEHIMGLPLREAREVFERDYLMAQISRFSGNISRTAEFVGMERSALHRKLKALGVG